MTAPAPHLRHPAAELLARYRAILAAAWAARHELAGPKRLADEAAFLPAALSLQETPVHPAPRRAMWAIMALFGLALAWACIGEVDIVAVAPGRIIVSDRTKVVQPLEAGVIKAIKVKDGDRVQAGQVLIELDPTTATADRESVAQQLKAAQAEAVRAKALLAALQRGMAGDGDAQQQAEWGDITAKQARLDAETARRQAEVATVQEAIAKLQATLPLAGRREADFKALTEQGFVSSHASQDRMRERIELERDLATQQARLHETQAALAESHQGKRAYLAEIRRTLNDRLTKAALDAAQLSQQGAKTLNREQLLQLAAPVSGTVQQLAVHTAGGVVTPAQPLLVIVPDDAEVTAEATLENKDIGFVRPGQDVAVKVDSFPFTRYGLVPATVLRVTKDAVIDDKRGAIFPALLSLRKAEMDIDGRMLRLTPGMTVSAEIKTGRRRVIDYLLSPVQQALHESLGER
ncbi:MAG: HlyD family type I secretion periplasmic adaptor subunit [Rubrivivax sp.]|jgi:hemolysin D|nr:HlyD family type I secretion periplasmic adaptor subunit [Rubrivivax sp.]